MRLDKFLSSCGKGTRKEVKSLIKASQVTVNDLIIKDEAYQVDEQKDLVKLNNEEVKYIKNIYIMLNKPQGYVSAVKDDIYPCVTSLVKEYQYLNLFPVGRLDVDTEGLLILTNDGVFAHDITSPSKHVDKTYYVTLEKELSKDDISTLEKGITLDGKLTKEAKIIPFNEGYHITISEGKYHQVKRMFHYVNNNVTYLKRIKIGSLSLDESLQLGEYKLISKDDI